MIRAEIGSRFAGTPSDTVEQLEAMLAREPLDAFWTPFELGPESLIDYRTRTPIYPDNPGAVRFRGNFSRRSYAFSVDTDEPAVIERLRAAILANPWENPPRAWSAR